MPHDEKCGHGACVRPKGHSGSHSVHLEGTPFAVPQGEDHEAAERAGMEAGCDEAERLGYGSELGYAEAAAISQKAIAGYLSHVAGRRGG